MCCNWIGLVTKHRVWRLDDEFGAVALMPAGSPASVSAVLMAGPEQAVLARETRLAIYPVAAVPADRAIPAQLAQPEP